MPPAYSAIKIGGVASYKRARAGEEIELKKRKVLIDLFEITEIKMPLVDFIVQCSKGTYIRSLAYDFGLALNSGAYLHSLRRTKIGEYSVEKAWALDELIHQVNTT
jgi:tRNA pseudouridine55 synthase